MLGIRPTDTVTLDNWYLKIRQWDDAQFFRFKLRFNHFKW
ncbi:MAG: hypothetical protein PWR12_345 [Eubacteriaceae bacterium]|nr:hypothetical protein [Eubacteriaceae bacterium]MDK2904269.1 hypothetical protein [Eubacteriaceae bacterium]MDK2936468.1 hypothetical protein [Eubacteriaceae bacterium]MDK2962235.1 hypothetical protein [Eubacteriaceae bacterium]